MSKRVKYILFSFVFLVTLLPLQLPTDLSANETLKESGLEKFVLENGLTVILKPLPKEKLASCQYWVNTGSAYEEEYTATGISHFIEHMIFKGSEDIIPQKKIGERIEDLGGKINAFTSHEVTNFYFKVPSAEITKGLSILADTIQSASFPEKEFDKERDVILRELDMNHDNPQKRLSQLLWKTSFIRHPYKYPIGGEKELFKQLTREDLLRYYYRKYMPNNSVLVVAGDFDPALVKKHIHETFGQLKASFFRNVALPQEAAQISPRVYKEPFEGTLAHVAMGFHSVSVNDPELFALDTFALSLASGEESILYKRLVKKEQLVYDIDSWNYTPKDKGLFGISFSCEPQNIEAATKVIWEEIENIKQIGLQPHELEKAKNQTLANYIFEKESPSSIASDIGYSEILTGSPDFSKYYTKGISNVSADDIKNVASKYLVTSRANTVMLLPKDFYEDNAAKIKTEEISEASVTTKYVLKNGLTVIVEKNDQLPVVVVACAFSGGLMLENESDNGITNLLSEMMLHGTKHLSSEDIFKQVETSGGVLSAYGGRNSSGILLKTLSKNTDDSIRLLSELLRYPTFPEDELSIAKAQISGYIKAKDEDLFQRAFKIAKKNLFKGHPYAMDSLGTLESIESISRVNVVKHYEKYITPQKTVITISGDVDTDAVISALKGHLESWKEKPFEMPEVKKTPAIQKQTEVIREVEKKQSVIIQSFIGSNIFSEDRYTLDIIASLLSSNSGRLFEAVREEKGKAYAVGAVAISGTDPGIFAFYCATTSQQIESVKKIFAKEIDKLINTPISESELDKYKKLFISGEYEAMEKSQDRALRFSLEELYGLGYDHYKQTERIISAITPETVQNTAKKYFSDNKYVITILSGKD